MTPRLKLTVGGRYERWRASHGLNVSAAPPLDTQQPELSKDAFSPKAVLAWSPSEAWTFKGSVAVANRFPTVSELYQAITTGTLLSVPNPNLRPERALSSELSAERLWTGGSLRVSLFDERIQDALLSQTAPLNGSAVSFVQNVDRTRSTGVEVVGDQKDLLIKGLELSGWVTYVDAKVVKDAAFAAAVGKQLPQLPRLRGSAVATWRATEQARSDARGPLQRPFLRDDRQQRPLRQHLSGVRRVFRRRRPGPLSRSTTTWSAAIGVDNLGNDKYFLFHPFPQRTLSRTSNTAIEAGAERIDEDEREFPMARWRFAATGRRGPGARHAEPRGGAGGMSPGSSPSASAMAAGARPPTTALRIELPSGVTTARPQAKPGWTIRVERAADGAATAVTWTGGLLPGDQFDDFVLLLRLPSAPGALYFPAVQTCGADEEQWTEVPDAGEDGHGLSHPAPSL